MARSLWGKRGGRLLGRGIRETELKEQFEGTQGGHSIADDEERGPAIRKLGEKRQRKGTALRREKATKRSCQMGNCGDPQTLQVFAEHLLCDWCCAGCWRPRREQKGALALRELTFW